MHQLPLFLNVPEAATLAALAKAANKSAPDWQRALGVIALRVNLTVRTPVRVAVLVQRRRSSPGAFIPPSWRQRFRGVWRWRLHHPHPSSRRRVPARLCALTVWVMPMLPPS